MSKTINPNKLILAREYNKLTQKEFIDKIHEHFGVKVSQGEISKIERGERKEVQDEILEYFSKTLDFPTKFFLEEWEILDVSGSLFRKRQTLKKRSESFINSSVNIFINACIKLLEEVELADINIPYYSLEDYKKPEEVARALRIYWKVPQGPIQNLIQLIEDNGIIVNYIDPESEKFDGYSRIYNKDKEDYAFIFINPNVSGDRLRFTLAHELGHLIMKNETNPYPKCEHEANAFASEFLMPENQIKSSLKNLHFEKAFYLKPYWKTSIASIIRKAKDLKQITDSRYTSLNVYLSKLGYKKQEPNPVPIEKPSLFREIIDYYLNELNYSIDELALKSGLTKNVLIKIHKPSRNKIRAIN